MTALRLKDLPLFVLPMVFWGFNFPISKLAFTEFPPIYMMALRFSFTALLLVPFAALPRDHWGKIFALSVLMGLLHFGTLFTGVSQVDGSLAALAIQTQVPFASILAAIFFKDYLGWRRAGGIVLAFAGLLLVLGTPNFSGHYLALGLIIFAAFTWALSNMLIKTMPKLSGWTINAWLCVFAAPQLFAASWVLEDGQIEATLNAGFQGWFGIFYMAVFGMIISYGIWYDLLKRYDVNQAMPFTLLVPVVGVLSSIWLLDEQVSLGLFAGAALTIAGVGIVVVRRPLLAGRRIHRI